MKKVFIIILGIFCISIFSYADYRADVLTPNGSNVVAWIMDESPNSWRVYLDDQFSMIYPNAQQIATYDDHSSSRKFNCHGYAWYMSELPNPLGSPRWIGKDYQTDEDIYMTDGSYIEVSTPTYPGKVSWASGDHSAVTTSQPGWLISKWNEYPLMRHQWNDSPFGTSNLKYYISSPRPTSPTIKATNGYTVLTYGRPSSSGTISATPGYNVRVNITANGQPGYTWTLSTGIAGVSVTGSTYITNGSGYYTFIMPASGIVSWSAYFSASNSAGSGTISVQ